MFDKILIANRGEIAVRVARTAHRLGVRSVAVFSEADRDAPHVRACDEAVFIGAAAPAESYLRIDRIIDAAKRTGAQAIHPGYGFLSENAAFADALSKEDLTFIGPTAETIRAMGSKSAAKDLMERAGVPTTPGYQGEDQSPDVFAREASRIGYPVLLKATAGGGGKGMRMVAEESELAEGLASAQREAKSAFGDDRFLIEKYLPEARHLEVQIFGDGRGEVVHLFERDCSVQRRHQKIIEEAPAPNLPGDVRARLLEAGVNAGKAVDYRGAGTVEFLYDGAESVYFMEMNTRLQVEHPVSEEITGIDLVEWQLRIAAGEPLPKRQDEIEECGHAFEARLYAENPYQNFAPSVGRIERLQLAPNARNDSGVEEGQTITPYYDPMIAKIIVHGADRNTALNNLKTALSDTRVAGLETNAAFLYALAKDEDFAAGSVSTRYIEHHEEALFTRPSPDARVYAAALMAAGLPGGGEAVSSRDPWDALAGFRLNRPVKSVHWIGIDDAPALARVHGSAGRYEVEIEPKASAEARRDGDFGGAPLTFAFEGRIEADGEVRLTIDSHAFAAFVAPQGDGVRVFIGADTWDVSFPNPLSGAVGHGSAEGSLTAPLPGVVTLLSASPGDKVEAGAPLLIMEAMKMEHTVKAPFDGVVKAYRFKPGDQVSDGDLMVDFDEAE